MHAWKRVTGLGLLLRLQEARCLLSRQEEMKALYKYKASVELSMHIYIYIYIPTMDFRSYTLFVTLAEAYLQLNIPQGWMDAVQRTSPHTTINTVKEVTEASFTR